MTDDGDLYAALGLTDDASVNDVADAYRRASPSAAATDAYDVLRDATRRRAYDDTRGARARAASAASRADHRVAPGQSEVELPLTFEQAALGTTATVHVPTESACPPCEGSGVRRKCRRVPRMLRGGRPNP